MCAFFTKNAGGLGSPKITLVQGSKRKTVRMAEAVQTEVLSSTQGADYRTDSLRVPGTCLQVRIAEDSENARRLS